MKYSEPFSELDKNSSGIAGGKGASLGEMLQAGIPVPNGFVVLSTTFDEFIKKSGLAEEIDAILDRGIPCIIGTKDGSRILNDGDEVEVNADTGIITMV